MYNPTIAQVEILANTDLRFDYSKKIVARLSPAFLPKKLDERVGGGQGV
jgi:hypothetical protein